MMTTTTRQQHDNNDNTAVSTEKEYNDRQRHQKGSNQPF